MFKNYIKIAFRNLIRQKGYSFINISGLAAGMACCILILLWVQDELSFDEFHENSSSLYRIVVDSDNTIYSASPWALAPTLKNEFPDILKATRVATRTRMLKYGDQSFFNRGVFIDADFLDMFSFSFITGDPKSAFSSKNSIVISKELSDKYFRGEEPVGKILRMDNSVDLTVTGVLENVPPNSHLQFDFAAPVELMGQGRITSWSWESSSYVLLPENAILDEVVSKISGTIMKYDKRTRRQQSVGLQPLSRVYLYALEGGGQIIYVYIFSATAICILLTACINFMNLATARSGSRAKEVGMRKVIGAVKRSIIIQFFGESLLLVLIAMLLAVAAVILILPAFNDLSAKQLSMNIAENWMMLAGLILMALFTGLVSGSYPAFFLSSFKPVKVIKGIAGTGSQASLLRRALVISQFTTTVALIIGTIIIYRQIDFIHNKDLGFDKEDVVLVSMNSEMRKSYESFKTEILQNPGIHNVTAANNVPLSVGNINPVYWEGKGPDDYQTMSFVSIDFDYIQTFGMNITIGRDFSKDLPTDTKNYLINEAALKMTGLEDPIGKMFSIWTREGRIIGIIKDFHAQPLQNEIAPIVFTLGGQTWLWDDIFIKIDGEKTAEALDYLKSVWSDFSPNYPFEYEFLEDRFLDQYRDVERTGNIFKYFTYLAIFISCLGLFGLASYMAEKRTKEIGIRKVLGANVSIIIRLLSKEFIILVIISNILAWPISYFAMSSMLSNYAYRTTIPLWIFFISGGMAVAIALISVSFQAVKAALTNPVLALKYE